MFKQIHEVLTDFFIKVGIPEKWLEGEDWWIYIYSTIGVSIATIFKLLHKAYQSDRLKRKQNFLNSDLYGRFTANDVFRATKNNIPAKYQFESPFLIQEKEEDGKTIKVEKYKLNKVFLRDYLVDKVNSEKYYIIFAGVGMGKSVAMINLYLAYKKNKSSKYPKFNIHLLPLGDKKTIEAIENIINKSQSIILLDAFDEDPTAVRDYNERFKELLKHIEPFRKVVITCRTQFFPSEKEEPYNTNDFTYGIEQKEYVFKKLYVSPFDNKDIQSYLRKVFDWWNPIEIKRYFRARTIIGKSKDLMIRPMLLYYIRDIVNEPKDNYTYQYQVYDILIDKWIENESLKTYVRKKYNLLEFRNLLFRVSANLAIDMYDNWEERGGLQINIKDIVPSSAAVLEEISESNTKKFGESKWRNYSLLNRDAKGNYKFAHRSILEFFLAKEAFYDKKLFLKINNDRLNVVKRFIQEIVFATVLKTSEGQYRQKKSDSTELPLQLLSINNLEKIKYIKIDISQKSNLHCLSATLPKKIDKIVLTDKKLPLLYLLYLILRRDSIQVNRSNEFYVSTFKIRQIEHILDYFGFYALLRRLQNLSRFGIKGLFDDLNLDIDKFLNQVQKNNFVSDFRGMLTWYHDFAIGFERIDKKDRTIQLEAQFPEIFESIREIDFFVKECEYLQQEFKESKVIY